MNTTKNLLFLCFIVCLLATRAAFSTPLFEPDRLSVAELKRLIPQLRQGGYVIYLRHAVTNLQQEDKRPVDLKDCKTQRNLSEQGRRQAKMIGRAIRYHKIPIGQIISSPFCRCQDTARLAFGQSNPHEALYFAMGLTREEKINKGKLLRSLLSQTPRSGENTVIVSHTANLQEAVGLWPKPEGVSYIFKLNKDDELDAIAIIDPQTWQASLN